MLNAPRTVYLLDVDNTLLDNDRFAADVSQQLDRKLGRERRERYWQLYADRRDAVGYADYLGTLQKLRNDCEDDLSLQKIAEYLLDYPFHQLLYPGAHEVIDHLRQRGTTALYSDGDVIFQPRKIKHSGLREAVDGQVLVVVHKEHCLELMQQRFPGDHHVMIDDKPHLLAAMKRTMGKRLTTVLVRQGHYGTSIDARSRASEPDISIDAIADLLALEPSRLTLAGSA